MTYRRWTIFAAIYAAMLALGVAICQGAEKPGLKIKQYPSGGLAIMPDLPAGTVYKWAEIGTGTDGKTWGICTWIADGKPEAATYWLPYRLDGVPPGPTPDPRPEPGPIPKPTPDPQPQPLPDAKVVAVYLVVETADATPATAAVKDAKAWKDYLDSKGIRWLCADDDSLVLKLPNVVAKARTNGLPSVVIQYRDNTAVAQPMPADPVAMLELVRGLK